MFTIRSIESIDCLRGQKWVRFHGNIFVVPWWTTYMAVDEYGGLICSSSELVLNGSYWTVKVKGTIKQIDKVTFSGSFKESLQQVCNA